MDINVYCQNNNTTSLYAGSNNLNVYHGMIDKFVNMVPQFYNLLSDYEKTKANRFKFESDYNGYISLHALLRIELSKLLKTNEKSIRIEESKNGKLFTSGMNLPFSISRTYNSFAFVIGRSDQFLGIDIEQLKPDVDFGGILRKYFSIKEQQSILFFDNIDEKNRATLELWTRKEALLKSIGVGIVDELPKVQVLEGKNQIYVEGMQIRANSFNILTFIKSMAVLSIASSMDFNAIFKELSY